MALGTVNTNQIASEAVTVPKVTDQVLTNRNLIINGAMTIDQRHDGSSFTVVNGNVVTGVIADRFRVNESSGAVMTGQRVADAPVGFEYSSNSNSHWMSDFEMQDWLDANMRKAELF